jgi:hypothetical protein
MPTEKDRLEDKEKQLFIIKMMAVEMRAMGSVATLAMVAIFLFYSAAFLSARDAIAISLVRYSSLAFIFIYFVYAALGLRQDLKELYDPADMVMSIDAKIRFFGSLGLIAIATGLIVGFCWPGIYTGAILPTGLFLLWIAERMWKASQSFTEKLGIVEEAR